MAAYSCFTVLRRETIINRGEGRRLLGGLLDKGDYWAWGRLLGVGLLHIIIGEGKGEWDY